MQIGKQVEQILELASGDQITFGLRDRLFSGLLNSETLGEQCDRLGLYALDLTVKAPQVRGVLWDHGHHTVNWVRMPTSGATVVIGHALLRVVSRRAGSHPAWRLFI
jgi:hypothetical protein